MRLPLPYSNSHGGQETAGPPKWSTAQNERHAPPRRSESRSQSRQNPVKLRLTLGLPRRALCDHVAAHRHSCKHYRPSKRPHLAAGPGRRTFDQSLGPFKSG
jgi:hypothetical protein